MAISDLQIELNSQLAARLKELRCAAGFTHKDLAARLTCSPTYILRLEGGTIPMSGAMIQILAREFGINAGDFFQSMPLASEQRASNVMDVDEISQRLAS